MTTLTRRYPFSASHRLHSPLLTNVENAELYGKCNNPYGHGHNYVLEVTVSGGVNSDTGLLVERRRLDGFVEERILKVFANRNINLDVPQFQTMVPTTENIALVVAGLLQERWHDAIPDGVTLQRIHIQETDRNGFELLVHA